MLTLYDYFRSSACFRVRIALNIKGLDYKTIPIHLTQNGGEQFSHKYQSINPQCLVPTLQNADKTLIQSIAIIEYLNEIHPQPSLMPTDPYEKALVRAFSLSIAADIHPLNNLRILKYLTNTLKVTEEQKQQWYRNWIAAGFSGLEKQLTVYNRSSNYCFGDEPTLADVCLVPQVYNARRFNCDLTPYPTLLRIDAHCQKHPAFTEAWPIESVA